NVLWIDGEHGSEVMIGGNVPIDLRVGIAAFVDANVVGIGKRRDARKVVTKIQRLEDKKLVSNDRARKSEMRGSALDAVRAVVNPAQARDGILEEKFPSVAPAAGVALDAAAAKAAIFRGEGIGEDAH